MSSSASVQTGDIRDSTLNLTQILYDQAAQSRVTFFSWQEEHEEINQLNEINVSSRYVYDEAFADGLLATLNQHRFLLLTGEDDSGKTSMARYLAGRLREEANFQRNTLVYGPQRKEVRLHLPSLLQKEENLHGRVLVFRDALEYQNPFVGSFLISMKAETVTSLTQDLARIECYLIMTAASSSLPGGCATNMPAWLRPSLPPLAPELVLQGVEAHLSLFFEQNTDQSLAGRQVSAEQKQQIAERGRTISWAARFIDSQLISILRGEKSVADAFVEFDSMSSWFQTSAVNNLEAWMYCLASVLADPLSSKEGVPWTEFFIMYDAVRNHLLQHRRPKAKERPFDEPALQTSSGITTKRDRTYARDLVLFKEASDVDRYWRILLTQFRALLTDLVPVLVELTGHDSPFVRSRAAQALGRIGFIDARAIAKPWLEAWSRSKNWQERSLVGYAVQGILSAGAADYRNFVLEWLDDCIERREQSWATVAAFKQIGMVDLSLGIEKLREVARNKLAPVLEEDRKIDRRLQQLGRQLAETGVPLSKVIVLLNEYYRGLFDDAQEIAPTFKYAIVALAMNELPSVLAHLSRWALGTSGMGALVCLLFLQKEGIADELTARKQWLATPQADGSRKDSTCNMVLASIIDSPEAVRVLATFLGDMYAALLDFSPPDLAALLKNLLFDYCKVWIHEALPIPSCRAAMVELVGRLLKSNVEDLWQRTYEWLTSDPDFSKPDMAAFARDARLF
jgi:energy-coupling factor transporter ATP-binding protein EcfA2